MFSQYRVVAATLVALALTGTTTSAQYFGRNKVQYKQLNFQVMKTEHFDIYFYPEEREGINVAARLAERWHTRLSRLLQHELSGRQPLILYASHVDFEQTNAIQGEIGEGTGGVTEPLKRRIVLPLGGPIADTDHVIGHELVHAFQFDITSRPGAPAGVTGLDALPLWFVEGMAEYLSIGPVDSNTAMWLRDAVRRDESGETLPSLATLGNPQYFPYRWGQAFWAYVGGRWGDGVIGEMLDIAGATGDIPLTVQRVLGVDIKQLSDDWQASIRQMYTVTAPREEALGQVVLKGKGGAGGDLNIGPAISPDGKKIAFLSERSLISIDLFVADAQTGKVLHKLTSAATDSHLMSLQFIYSAGAWDAESKRFAIATIADGRPAIVVYNADTGKKEHEYKITTIDEVFNPTWAPDGHAICFTGMTRGLTDLFVYDFQTGEVRQLTNDPFADLQPAWSPDGKRIAFATDRFSSNLTLLDMGDYRVAFIDPLTGAIQQVSAFTSGKNINPQWAPDGATLYFISDRDGIPNLYAVTIASGAVSQLTVAGTGLSGITATSPALSVASRSGIAAFSVYNAGGYEIHTLQLDGASVASEAAGGSALATRVDLTPVSQTAAVLPPLDRKPSDVAELLSQPALGLPPVADNEVENYDPSLSLTAVSQPAFAVGGSRFGAFVAGGISFLFGDLLGNHTLEATVQFNSSLNGNFSIKDTAAGVTYLNQAHRWNWGVTGSQIPYVSGYGASGFSNINGVPVVVDQTIMYRQTERTAGSLLAYPLSRARRVELQGGFTQFSTDRIVRSETYTLNGNLISDETVEAPYGDTLNLASTSAALVFDTSTFGATSPVNGQRYRFEASPTFGTVRYAGMMADYRRYFMPVPFYTVAGRVLHYGRYGQGGEDPRLVPLDISYPTLVRGYDINTLEPSECISTSISECPAYDRLLGSRILVANLELRFPLLRPFGVSQNMYGPLPIEVAFFADSGLAWTTNTTPKIFGGEREAVTSVGTSVRVNLMGFAVGSFDFSRPLQRPQKGWVFQFTLAPGF